MSELIALRAKDGHELVAYRAGAKDAALGVVVVQEIFGVNRHMREVCDRIADRGFAVVAPALFDRVERGIELGYGPADSARGRELRSRVPDAGAVADIEVAASVLPAQCAIVGYCWGGTIAWWGATRTHAFKAAVAWYGGGIAATRDESPHCPVQLHFGELDGGISMDDVRAIRIAQPEIELFTYPGVGHGFGCDERDSFNAAANDLAEARTLEFLAAHL